MCARLRSMDGPSQFVKQQRGRRQKLSSWKANIWTLRRRCESIPSHCPSPRRPASPTLEDWSDCRHSSVGSRRSGTCSSTLISAMQAATTRTIQQFPNNTFHDHQDRKSTSTISEIYWSDSAEPEWKHGTPTVKHIIMCKRRKAN